MSMQQVMETSVEPHITISRVSKTFRGRKGEVQALQDIDLTIARGEFVTFLGPSGCGKSTLLMLVSGLIPSSQGRIKVGDKFITEPNSDVGIVFQQDVLLEWRNALQNVMIQAEIRKTDLGAARDRARQLLKMVSLEDFENAYPKELSGGMRQRVSICRALLHKPPLLLMDEPFGALDAMTRDQLQLDLLRLCADNEMTVFFITHSIPEAVFLSDRIVVISPRPGRSGADPQHRPATAAPAGDARGSPVHPLYPRADPDLRRPRRLPGGSLTMAVISEDATVTRGRSPFRFLAAVPAGPVDADHPPRVLGDRRPLVRGAGLHPAGADADRRGVRRILAAAPGQRGLHARPRC